MDNELIRPDKFFLRRFGMTEGTLERILGTALERKADYADLYFEYRSAEGLSLEDSIVNRTSKSLSHGVGVRVCAEDRTGYAYSDEVTLDRMRLAAETARRSRFRWKSVRSCSTRWTASRARSTRASRV